MLGVGRGGPVGAWTATDASARSLATPTRTPAPLNHRPRLTERQAWAVLTAVNGLGPVGFGALLRVFGSGRAILDAARRPGAGGRLVAAGVNDGRETFDSTVAAAIVAVAEAPGPALRNVELPGLEIVTTEDPGYPSRLLAIELPPHVLFVRGSLAALEARHAIAVVGTRRPTESGRAVAARIGGSLARAGATVVSGLAVGIDGASHAAAMAEGGATVAVLGSGHRRLYPHAHARLADRIVADGGAVVSELAPDTGATRSSFPRRNRIISGLSDATVVVEAGLKSGALITAAWALEQGRELFMVPGGLDDPHAAGCLEWLHDYPGRATVVPTIPQLIHDLELLDDAPTRARRPSLEAELVELGATASAVARALRGGGGTVDELVAATGHNVATVLGALTMLEVRGLASSAYGRYRPAGRLASARRVGPASG
ncbi:MAG TPA: DNA-processing protein DprA [Candidatus Limnocylindrales bacterium]|nr:DNA-processing protein DprA [Candidatus Limnocylindrales bacterium]